MDNQIEQLRADNARIRDEIVELNELSKTEDRDFSAEEQEKFDRLSETFDKNKAARERLERIREIDAVQEGPTRQAVAAGQVGEPQEQSSSAVESRAEYGRVFDKWFRFGKSELTSDEKLVFRSGFSAGDEARALGDNPQTITTTGGGNAIPDEAMPPLQENLLTFGGLRRAPISVHQTATGAPWPVPSVNDTGNSGSLLAINTGTVDAKATFNQIVFNAYKFTSGLILVPTEFLQDVAFDAVSWAMGALGERIARGLAPYLINGDGAAEPGGLDMAGSLVTAAGAAAITRDDIIDLIHNVDPGYRRSPAFGLVFNDSTLAALKKLAFNSSDARPLWQASMAVGEPDRIDGVPYHIVTEVTDIGAGLRSIYAGDLSKFWLREAGPVRVLRMDERFGEKDQVAFVAFARYDSNIIDAGTAPIHYLRHPAS